MKWQYNARSAMNAKFQAEYPCQNNKFRKCYRQATYGIIFLKNNAILMQLRHTTLYYQSLHVFHFLHFSIFSNIFHFLENSVPFYITVFADFDNLVKRVRILPFLPDSNPIKAQNKASSFLKKSNNANLMHY